MRPPICRSSMRACCGRLDAPIVTDARLAGQMTSMLADIHREFGWKSRSVDPACRSSHLPLAATRSSAACRTDGRTNRRPTLKRIAWTAPTGPSTSKVCSRAPPTSSFVTRQPTQVRARLPTERNCMTRHYTGEIYRFDRRWMSAPCLFPNGYRRCARTCGC